MAKAPYSPELDTLEFRIEAALKTYLLSVGITGNPNIYTGEETEDRELPAIVCECHGGPENPPGTNNFLEDATVCIVSNVDETESDADPFPPARRLVEQVKYWLWDALLDSNANEHLHEILTAQVPNLQVQNQIQFHGPVIAIHDRKMITELKFTMQAYQGFNGVAGPAPGFSLHTLLPVACGVAQGSTECHCPAGSTTIGILPGIAGKTYQYTFLVSGLVELKSYTGGTQSGFFYTGGSNANDGNANSYGLVVTTPANAPNVTASQGQFFLNASTGGAGRYQNNVVQYKVTLTAQAGQAMVLTTNSFDGFQASNPNALTVPGITSPAQPFNGQFIRLDLVNAVQV